MPEVDSAEGALSGNPVHLILAALSSQGLRCGLARRLVGLCPHDLVGY